MKMYRKLPIVAILCFVLVLSGQNSFACAQERDAAVRVDSIHSGMVVEEFAIYYRVNKTDIDTTYLDNPSQIRHILRYISTSPKIDSIVIYAWASPEGSYRFNKYLSIERAKAAKRFLLEHSPDSSRFNSEKIRISPLAENWPGLLRLVEEKYHRHDRDKVISILNENGIGDETRKWRLKQLDGGYTWSFLIRRYMPELRAATWISIWEKIIEPVNPITDPNLPMVMPQDSTFTRIIPEKPVFKKQKTVVGLKTNLLYDAVTALNYSIEVPFNKHLSLQFEQHTPWWLARSNKYCLQFLSLGGEFRWWFAPRTSEDTGDRKLRDALVGHFLGLNVWGGKSDIQWGRDFGCYQFEFMSAGLTYGYSMPISKHLNLEFSITAGYARVPYQHYIPTDDWQILIKDKNNAGTLHYFGPTKAEVSLTIPIRATFKTKGGAR